MTVQFQSTLLEKIKEAQSGDPKIQEFRNQVVTPCFPKYRVRIRDDGQQKFTKREISSVNILLCSNGAKFLYTYTKNNQKFYFHAKDILR